MTGDQGIPFPRCKANIYDSVVRVPFAIRWGKEVKAGRAIDDFISFTLISEVGEVVKNKNNLTINAI